MPKTSLPLYLRLHQICRMAPIILPGLPWPFSLLPPHFILRVRRINSPSIPDPKLIVLELPKGLLERGPFAWTIDYSTSFTPDQPLCVNAQHFARTSRRSFYTTIYSRKDGNSYGSTPHLQNVAGPTTLIWYPCKIWPQQEWIFSASECVLHKLRRVWFLRTMCMQRDQRSLRVEIP